MSFAPNRRSILIVLAYLGPLALVPLCVPRGDADLRWHARQGLLLFVLGGVVLGALAATAGLAVLTGLGAAAAIAALTWALWIATLLLQFAALVTALNGRRLGIPLVSGIASRLARQASKRA